MSGNILLHKYIELSEKVKYNNTPPNHKKLMSERFS